MHQTGTYATALGPAPTTVPASTVRVRRPLAHGARALVGVGDAIEPGQPVAERADGLLVLAGLAGVVSAVDAHAVTIAGAAWTVSARLAIGDSATAPLVPLSEEQVQAPSPLPAGTILFYAGRLTLPLLQRCASAGAVAVIGSSIGAWDLEAYSRTDLTAVLDRLVPPPHPPVGVLAVQGLTPAVLAPDLLSVLRQAAGQMVLVEVEAPARARLVVGAPPAAVAPSRERAASTAILAPGLRVVASGGPWTGLRGIVVHVFTHDQPMPSGIFMPAAMVRADDAALHMVPTHLLDVAG